MLLLETNPTRETVELQGCETKRVTVSHLLCVLPLSPPASSSPAVRLSPPSRTPLPSLPGPQNKDSRESLTYDGEEKEVRVESFY